MTEGEAVALAPAPSLRSRFNSFLSSRFCSFFSRFVNSSPGDGAGVEAARDEDVDVVSGETAEDEVVALGEGEAVDISSVCLDSKFGRGDWDLARGFAALPEPAGATGDAEGLGVEGMRVVSTGELLAAVGCGVALGIVRGDGVALGTSKRPRRCDAAGGTDADETGENVADAAALGAIVAARRGGVVDGGTALAAVVAVATGVAVAATVGAAVDVDVGVVSLVVVVALVAALAFTNFLDGAFVGGGASDFIFARVFFASS